MPKCPIETCGRQFQNQLTMIQHVKRRHPLQSQKIREQTTNEMLQKQVRITQEMNKLPKMQRVIQMSKEKKTLEFQRRSTSKQRKEIKNIVQNSQIKVSDIITESRQLVEDNNSSRKILKRPSLSKKPSQQTVDKLPSIVQSKVRKLKLQGLKSQFGTPLAKQQSQKTPNNFNHKQQGMSLQQQQMQSQMYSTAPNFAHQVGKKIDLIKSRGQHKQDEMALTMKVAGRSSSKDKLRVSENIKKRLSSHTAETLAKDQTLDPNAPAKTAQRPIKRLLQRTSKKEQNTESSSSITNQQLSESVYIESKIPSAQQLGTDAKKVFSFQPKGKLLLKDDKKFMKKEMSPVLVGEGKSVGQEKSRKVETELNWQERTVTVRNKDLSNFQVPSDAQVEFLYITNCKVEQIDLNECFSLTSLTLTHNNLSSFSFLQPTINGSYENIEQLYLDHNVVSSLSSLPTYLQIKKLSLSFNQVEGLDEVTRTLVKFPFLQELDLSFNPVRKQPNYKLAVLSVCPQLKKLDGMVVTRFDRQMSQEYSKMYYDYLKILPLSSIQKHQATNRPSTAVSINYQQQFQTSEQLDDMTEQQLSREIELLQKMIKQTKDQYEIIQEENGAIEDEIREYEGVLSDRQDGDDQFSSKVYLKLCKEVQELEMLNFLQFASEKELEDVLMRKVKERGLTGMEVVV